ncbi:MAG TPA: TolC family protein [Acidobacteriaceae bacterium]|nr:TolC family protein [Acidobacteriaceae bacterium]
MVLGGQSVPLRSAPVAGLSVQSATQATKLPMAPVPQAGTAADVQLPASQSAPLVLSLSDAIAMAERNSPRLREASAISQRTTSAARTARAYSNPSLEVFEGEQYARAVSIPGIPGLLQHYAAYQTIEIPSERRARQNAAQFQVASSRAYQQAVMFSVVADAKRAFYSALRRREQIAHAEENLQLVQDLRRRVELEVRIGEKGRLELTRAEAEMARAQFMVRSARLQYANAIALLRVAIAAPADANLDPKGDFSPSIALPPLEQMREEVLRAHPVVAQSQADIQRSQATLDLERALRIPRPTAFVEYENQPDLRFWRAGVTVPIPLWDRRRGQIGEAKAAISQSTAVLEQRRLELISALERSYEQYQLADQQVTSLESGSLRATESAVDAAKAAYRFGERGIVEVLDAQRVLQTVRGDLLDAQFARQTALVDLEELGAMSPGARP